MSAHLVYPRTARVTNEKTDKMQTMKEYLLCLDRIAVLGRYRSADDDPGRRVADVSSVNSRSKPDKNA